MAKELDRVEEHQRDPCADKCTAFSTVLDSSWNQLFIFDVVGLENVKPPMGSILFIHGMWSIPLPGGLS